MIRETEKHLHLCVECDKDKVACYEKHDPDKPDVVWHICDECAGKIWEEIDRESRRLS